MLGTHVHGIPYFRVHLALMGTLWNWSIVNGSTVLYTCITCGVSLFDKTGTIFQGFSKR